MSWSWHARHLIHIIRLRCSRAIPLKNMMASPPQVLFASDASAIGGQRSCRCAKPRARLRKRMQYWASQNISKALAREYCRSCCVCFSCVLAHSSCCLVSRFSRNNFGASFHNIKKLRLIAETPYCCQIVSSCSIVATALLHLYKY